MYHILGLAYYLHGISNAQKVRIYQNECGIQDLVMKLRYYPEWHGEKNPIMGTRR